MTIVELRPLSLGELLDRAFTLYRRNFWLFIGIMAIPSCLIIPMQFFILRNRATPFPWGRPMPQTHATSYAFVFLFVIWILYSIVHGAITYAVADTYLGRSSTVLGAFSRTRRRVWRILGLSLNIGIRVFGLIILLIFLGAALGGVFAGLMTLGGNAHDILGPAVAISLALTGFGLGVWFSLRYAVSIPAMLLEDGKGRKAIRRSVELSRGRRGQLFIAILMSIVISYAGVIIFQGPFYVAIAVMKIRGQLPNWLALSLSASGSIGGAITGPLLMIVLVLCYYDLRIRKEGFDIEFMMTSLPVAKPVDSSGAI